MAGLPFLCEVPGYAPQIPLADVPVSPTCHFFRLKLRRRFCRHARNGQQGVFWRFLANGGIIPTTKYGSPFQAAHTGHPAYVGCFLFRKARGSKLFLRGYLYPSSAYYSLWALSSPGFPRFLNKPSLVHHSPAILTWLNKSTVKKEAAGAVPESLSHRKGGEQDD